MTDKKNTRLTLDRFTLRGVGGLVGLVTVAILAFSFGAIIFGPDEQAIQTHEHADLAETKAPTVWTCSMHPQIKLPKEGKCPLCFMDLIPLEIGTDEDLGPRQLRMSESSKNLARIQTTAVVHAFAEAEIRMLGKISYDETRLSYITAWVAGRLDRLYADFTGMRVKQGDHMVSIYSPELLAAQEELLQSVAIVSALDRSASRVLKATAAATLDATRDKLRLFGLSPEQIKKIETDGTTTDHLTIPAPIGGVVIHKNAQEGMYVKTGSRIYTIADLSKLWVMFEAYESDLPWLRYGQQVSFSSESFPGKTFEAIISFIDPVVDPKTRTVNVRAIVDNKKQNLKPDMFVRGVVLSRLNATGEVIDNYLAGKWISPMHPEVVKNGPGSCDVCGMDLVRAETLGYASSGQAVNDAPLIIPTTAPMITGKRAIVYVEIPNDEGPLFEGREVSLGPRAGDFYVVRSGLKEGELVVTNGAFKIDSELQIQAKPSMMSPDGGAPPAGHQHGQPKDNSTNQTHSSHDQMANSTTNDTKNSKVAAALTPLYTAYFDLQMALAGDDLTTATTAAEKVKQAASEVDMAIFSRSGHTKWMTLSKQISGYTAKAKTAENIEAARDSFFYLSKSVIDLQDTFGHADGIDYYLTYCPMARDNTGAFWLQTVNVVNNSFYGASMLRCGEIKATLPSGEEN